MNKNDQILAALLEALREVAKTQVDMAKNMHVLALTMTLISSSIAALAEEARRRMEHQRVEE